MFVLKMAWRDLLFAHWPIDPDVLRPCLPVSLPLDIAEGQAWVSVVPFRMTGVGPRGLPGHSFPELNVRTYVRHHGRPGVWFFSLDASSPLAVRLARRFFHLNYCDALINVTRDGEWTRYQSQRTHRNMAPALLDVRYRPTGPALRAPEGSLDHWLTERYSFYTVDPLGRLQRGDIRHEPWPLQPAEAVWHTNAMTSGLGFALEGPPPLVAYARQLKVKGATLAGQ